MKIISNATAPVRRRIAKRIFLEAVKRIRMGRLVIEHPDGRRVEFDSSAPGPSAVLQVKDDAFYGRLLAHGEIGFGEAYQAGMCDSPDLVSLLELALVNRRSVNFNTGPMKFLSRWKNLRLHRRRANTVDQAKDNIHAHYDMGNDFFQLFLDETMTYSSAVFEHPGEDLADAQRNKYRRLAELAGATAADHVLEIGTGWGGNAIFLASTYGCKVTTVTISTEQAALARERISEAGLSHLIDVLLTDYRDVQGQFDKVISIEMFEAVGAEFFETFFLACSRALKPGGRLAMQVITVPDRDFEAQRSGVNWIQKYIFPGGVLPSLAAMEHANARTGLVLISSDDIGPHYETTLHQWRERFQEHLDEVRAQGYDQHFINTWDYYLAACEAGFRTRTTGDVHVVFEKPVTG